MAFLETAIESIRNAQNVLKKPITSSRASYTSMPAGVHGASTRVASPKQFTDSWQSNRQWLRNNMQSGGKYGMGTLLVNGERISITMPKRVNINGYDKNGKPVYAYGVNAVMEDSEWQTVGTVRATSQLSDNSFSRNLWVGVGATAGASPIYKAANPDFYDGLVFTEQGQLAHLNKKSKTSVDIPDAYSPPEGGAPDLELNKVNQIGAKVDVIATAVQVTDSIMKDQYQNFYHTQVLIQQNSAGEKRAIIVASQIGQVLSGDLTLMRIYLTVDSKGNLVPTHINYPNGINEFSGPTISASKTPKLPIVQVMPYNADNKRHNGSWTNIGQGHATNGKTMSDLGYKNPLF